MATPQDLDRLRALLGQLTALGGARRGELIRAEDWNTLVGAIADVARAVLAADAAPVIPAHEHVDQVASAWLAPALRELFERGPLADPAMQQRLATIEQTLRRLAENQDGNRDRIDEFRGRLTDVAGRDLERQSALAAVRRQLDAVIDPRPDLQAMRSSLGAVQRDMSTVLDAASRLSVGGVVVDVGALATRVGDLEQLRERFRLANGELLDAATVERRLAEIGQRALTSDALDDALNRHRFELSPEQSAALEERIGTRQREQTNSVLDAFRGEIDTRVASRLDGLGTLVEGRIADALPGVEAGLVAALGARIDAARQAAVTTAQQTAQAAIDGSAAALRTEFGTRIDALNAGLGAQIDGLLTPRLASSLATLTARIDGASARLDALGAQSSGLADTQRAHAAQLASLPQELASLRVELRRSLQEEIGVQVAAVNRRVDERLTAFARDNDLRFETLRGEISAQAVDAARRAAVDTAQAGNTSLRTQLLAEMRGIAREELNVAVNDAVRSSVDRAVATQFANVPNLVAAEVQRQRLVVRNEPVVVNPVVLNPGISPLRPDR
jgi:hypothetical protein